MDTDCDVDRPEWIRFICNPDGTETEISALDLMSALENGKYSFDTQVRSEPGGSAYDLKDDPLLKQFVDDTIFRRTKKLKHLKTTIKTYFFLLLVLFLPICCSAWFSPQEKVLAAGSWKLIAANFFWFSSFLLVKYRDLFDFCRKDFSGSRLLNDLLPVPYLNLFILPTFLKHLSASVKEYLSQRRIFFVKVFSIIFWLFLIAFLASYWVLEPTIAGGSIFFIILGGFILSDLLFLLTLYPVFHAIYGKHHSNAYVKELWEKRKPKFVFRVKWLPKKSEKIELSPEEKEIKSAYVRRNHPCRRVLSQILFPISLALIFTFMPLYFVGTYRMNSIRDRFPGQPLTYAEYNALPLPPEPHAAPLIAELNLPKIQYGIFAISDLHVGDVDPAYFEDAEKILADLKTQLEKADEIFRIPYLGIREHLDNYESKRGSPAEKRADDLRMLLRLQRLRIALDIHDGKEVDWEKFFYNLDRIQSYFMELSHMPLIQYSSFERERYNTIHKYLSVIPDEILASQKRKIIQFEQKIPELFRKDVHFDEMQFVSIYDVNEYNWGMWIVRPILQSNTINYTFEALAFAEGDYYNKKEKIDAYTEKLSSIGLPYTFFLMGDSLEKLSVLQGCYALQARAAETTIAIEQYRRIYGDIPENLSMLVPEFLSSVPVDPFDGKPLRYVTGAQKVNFVDIVRGEDGEYERKNQERELPGYRIYSIGPDLIDDFGEKPYSSREKSGDITFRYVSGK